MYRGPNDDTQQSRGNKYCFDNAGRACVYDSSRVLKREGFTGFVTDMRCKTGVEKQILMFYVACRACVAEGKGKSKYGKEDD